MSSRAAEKERRRASRIERDREHERQELRRRTRTRLWYLAMGAAVIGGALAVILSAAGSKHQTTSSAGADSAFGQHYAGLEQRRQAAGVPTMMDTMSSPVHFHPLLKVFVDGTQVPVPANIGIDPTKDPMQMAGLHTHDATGTVHVEGVAGAHLGQFFAIWGVPLTATQLGPYRTGGGKVVRMWVDGKRSTAFGQLALADGQRIVISFGQKTAPPPAA
jgi:hypothetical protein